MRQLERFNIDIDAGTRTAELRSLKLDNGTYTAIQVINRFNTNLDIPVEIQVKATNEDAIPRVDIRALEPAGGDFFESKAPVQITGSDSVDITLTAASNLAVDGSYQIIFWKAQC